MSAINFEDLEDSTSAPASALVPPSEPEAQVVPLELGDVTLTARYYEPAASAGPARGAVLIVPAMGVPQTFYACFAHWLSSRGFHTLTFDYRGSGESAQGPLADCEADVVTWAERDTQAALLALTERVPHLPVTWIGHSLGGQIVPFVPCRSRVSKIVTIAAGSGYWPHNTPALRRKVWLFWGVLVPVLTPLFGYFPGRRLGMVGDLPRGVVMQWRRWCLDPEYAAGAEGPSVRRAYAEVKTPISSISLTDDEMMSAASIRGLHRLYEAAHQTAVRIDPREIGLRRVGHFGFFRAEMQAPLWEAHLLSELAERR